MPRGCIPKPRGGFSYTSRAEGFVHPMGKDSPSKSPAAVIPRTATCRRGDNPVVSVLRKDKPKSIASRLPFLHFEHGKSSGCSLFECHKPMGALGAGRFYQLSRKFQRHPGKDGFRCSTSRSVSWTSSIVYLPFLPGTKKPRRGKIARAFWMMILTFSHFYRGYT